MKKPIIITVILMLLIVVSCANMSSSEKGALTGAGIGAAGGAAITAIAGGNAAIGAAVGGAAGAVAGGLIGGNKEKKRMISEQEAYDLAQPSPRTHIQHFPCLSVSIQLINGDIQPKPGAAGQAVSGRYLRNMQL